MKPYIRVQDAHAGVQDAVHRSTRCPCREHSRDSTTRL